MLSTFPVDLAKTSQEEIDKQILRAALMAELDAINIYEQMAGMAQSENIKKVLYAVAKEEKEHVGEFQTLLLMLDKEQVDEMKEGKKEVEEMIG